MTQAAQLPRPIRTLLVARAVNQLGAFSVPYLAVVIVARTGTSVASAGLIVTVFGAATIPSRLLGGRLLPVLGHRRTIVAGLVGCALAQFGLALSTSVAAAAGCALALGLAFEVYEPASQAAIADGVPPESRVRAFGYLSGVLAVAGIASGLLGAVIGRWDPCALCAVDGMTCLACALVVAVGVTVPAPPPATTSARTDPRPWRDGSLLMMLACGTALAFVYLAIAMALPLALSRRGFPAADAGWLFALSGLTVALGRWARRPGQAGTDPAGHRHTGLPVGIAIIAIGLAGYAFAPGGAGLALATVVWASGWTLVGGHPMAIVAGLAPPDGRGRYLAVYGISWGVAGVVAPLVVTQVLTHGGVRVLWCVLGALALVLAAVQARVLATLERRRPPSGTGAPSPTHGAPSRTGPRRAGAAPAGPRRSDAAEVTDRLG